MQSALAKRIKRHVVGRTHVFFAATAPGLEDLCAQELVSMGGQPPPSEIRATAGGVEFAGRIATCCEANLHLRTANRILMRIAAFNALDFGQLEKKLSEIPWELYLDASVQREFKVSCRHSRLYHSDAVAQRCQKAVEERLQAHGILQTVDEAARPKQLIFVLARNDRFTISLDCSGDLLHKRGYRSYVGRAPIRETLASAILMSSGYTGAEPLIDPMCGSGTFSFEAAAMAQNVPPGIFRGFAFERWPCFRPRKWAYIKKTAEERMLIQTSPIVFASDTDPKAAENVENVIRAHPVFKAVAFAQRDFFDFSPADVTPHRGLVVLNPPYGLRMTEQPGRENLLKEIEKKLLKDYRGWKLALITPDRKYSKKLPFHGKTRPIVHGGLRLSLVLGEIPS